MNKEDWESDNNECYLDSKANIQVPWLKQSLETWIELESGSPLWTSKQEAAFENFLKLPSSVLTTAEEAILKIYHEELHENRIESLQFSNILDSIDWSKTNICVPIHHKTKYQYVILLPKTKWKIVDSDCYLELELLFTNGDIELAQEMSGIWCRIEWNEYYLKRRKLPKTG